MENSSDSSLPNNSGTLNPICLAFLVQKAPCTPPKTYRNRSGIYIFFLSCYERILFFKTIYIYSLLLYCPDKKELEFNSSEN